MPVSTSLGPLYFGNARNGMQRYWKDKLSAADTACKRLELGEKHPDIEKAIADLSKYRGSAKGTVTQLKKDYNEWLREVRKLRKFSDEDRNALRDVLCTAGEYEMEAKVKDVADRWASQISSVYGTTFGQADRLKSRAQARELAKYKGPKEVLTGIVQNLSNLEKLKNYELQGSNNPAIRAKMEWGKKRHLDLQGSCTYAELEISSSDCDNRVRPGSGCRVDCVKTGSTCVVIEFKPDNPPAKAEGDVQLTSYISGLRAWYQRDKSTMFSKYPSLAQCENSDKTSLNLDRSLVTYEMCSATVRNDFGALLDEATLDLAETSE